MKETCWKAVAHATGNLAFAMPKMTTPVSPETEWG